MMEPQDRKPRPPVASTPSTARRSRQGDPALAVGYLRVSTDKQELGLDVQAAAIEKWCSSRGIRLLATHADEAVSGAAAAADRPGLMTALAALRELGAGVLVAHKRDRFARDSGIMGEVERLARRRGAELRTADGASDGIGFAGAVQRESLDFIAKLERLAIRDRTSAGLRRKMERGEAAGGNPPFGWRIVKIPMSNPDDIRKFRRDLEADPAEQQALALIVQLDQAGLSWAEIARRLAAEGHSPRGRDWYPKTVQRLLRRYCDVPRPPVQQ